VCAIAAALGINATGNEALNQLLTQVGEAAGFIVASLTSGSIELKELIAGGEKQKTT
jgi:hypothetical protein